MVDLETLSRKPAGGTARPSNLEDLFREQEQMKINKVRGSRRRGLSWTQKELVKARRELQQLQSSGLDTARGQPVNANDKSRDGLLAFIFGLATLWFRLLQRRH